MHRRFRLCLAGALAILLAETGPAGTAPAPVSSAIIVSAVAPVRPVTGADHRVHLAYELLVVNPSRLVVTLESVAAQDGATGEIISDIDGEDLAAMMVASGEGPPGILAPGQSAFLLMDVALPEDADPPRTLMHRFQTSRVAAAKTGSAGSASPAEGVPAPTATFVGGDVAVERVPALTLAPPVRGSGWLVLNGCCGEANRHRGRLVALDGRVTVPERFAIDLVRLGPDGRLFSGPAAALSSYACFGAAVLAATDGVVVGLLDGLPDASPNAPAIVQAPANRLGNYVVVVSDGGRYLLYANLKAGSFARKVGDPIKAGDTIGLIGNSGEGQWPHLHFEVLDNPSPFAANGMPYVFPNFTGLGRIKDAAAVLRGEPAAIDKAAFAGGHRREMPLDREVIEFE